jgi:hypothetical protein
MDSTLTQFLLSTSFNSNPVIIQVTPNVDDAIAAASSDNATPPFFNVFYTTSTLFYNPCPRDLASVVLEDPHFFKINPDLLARILKDLSTIGNVIIDGFLLRDHFTNTGTIDHVKFTRKLALLNMAYPPHVIFDSVTIPLDRFDQTFQQESALGYIKALQEYGREALDWVVEANKRANNLGTEVVKLRNYMQHLPMRLTICEKFPPMGTGQSDTSSVTKESNQKTDAKNPREKIIADISNPKNSGETAAVADISDLEAPAWSSVTPDLDNDSSNSDSDLDSNWNSSRFPSEVNRAIADHMESGVYDAFEDDKVTIKTEPPFAPLCVPRSLSPELSYIRSPVAIAVAGSVTANTHPHVSNRKKGRRVFPTYRNRYCTRKQPDVECLYPGMANLNCEDQTSDTDEASLMIVT